VGDVTDVTVQSELNMRNFVNSNCPYSRI